MAAVTFTLQSLPGSASKVLRFEPRDAPWTFGGAIVTPDGFQRSYTRGVEHTEDLPIGAWRIRIGTQWYSFDVGDDGGDLATLIAWGIPSGTPASTLTAAVESFGAAWLASFTDTTLAEKVSATGTVRTAVDDRIRTVGDANYAPLGGTAKAWQASTVYATGVPVFLPNGKPAIRTASGTSRPAFDSTEEALWTVTAGGTTTVDGLTDATTVGKAVAKATNAAAARAVIDAATPGQITTAINDLVSAAPGALNTLDELAAALGDDANFASTVTTSIAGKYTKPGSGVPWGDLADIVLASLWRNVKFYGAVGNGVANDTTAIQNAINACAPGETILFPPGTYLISAALSIKSGVSLRGSSIGTDAGTIIKATSAFTGAMLQSAVLASGSKTLCDDPMSIRGLTLDGNKAVLTSATFDGIALCAYWARIQGVYIRNIPRHAIRLTDQRNDAVNVTNSCSENRVIDCKIATIGGNGIHQESNNGNSNLDGFCESNLLSDIAGTAIQFAKSAGWSFKRNHAYGIGVNGIDLSGCFATSVVENYVEDCGGANLAAQFYVGIRIQQLDGWASQVIGNHVRVPAKGTATQRTGYRLLTGGGQTTAVIAFIGNTAAGSGGAGCVPAQFSGISSGILTIADRGNHFRGFDSNAAQVDSGVVSVGDLAQAAALAAKADLTGGKVPTSQLGSGTANTSTYLRGDQTWQPITAGETDTAGSEVDYAESAITETLGTSAADIPGLALTFATGDNPAMVEFYPAGFFGNNTGTITYQIIRTSDGAVLAMGIANVTTTVGYDFPAAISKRIPAGTASDTYKAQAFRSAGSATCTVNPGAKTMYLQAKAL